jgi:hypothetical protein
MASFILQSVSTAKDTKVSTMPFDGTLGTVGSDGDILIAIHSREYQVSANIMSIPGESWSHYSD